MFSQINHNNNCLDVNTAIKHSVFSQKYYMLLLVELLTINSFTINKVINSIHSRGKSRNVYADDSFSTL